MICLGDGGKNLVFPILSEISDLKNPKNGTL